jgi:hypothetical protein
MVGWLQIVTMLYQRIDFVHWPEGFSEVVKKLNVVNLGFSSLSGIMLCQASDITFYDILVLQTCIPLGIVMLIVCVSYVLVHCFSMNSNVVQEWSWYVVFLLTFLVCPSVSQTIFQCFQCTDDINGSTYLEADMRIMCDSSEYQRYWMVAIAAIFVYPLGIPMLYLGLLCRKYHEGSLFLTEDLQQRQCELESEPVRASSTKFNSLESDERSFQGSADSNTTKHVDSDVAEAKQMIARFEATRAMLGFLYVQYQPYAFWWETVEVKQFVCRDEDALHLCPIRSN